jgi:sugar lactone lactonase YvrE
MKNKLLLTKLSMTIGLLLAGTSVFADSTRFADFTPLATSAGTTFDEAQPVTFGSPKFIQESIADRETQLADGKPNATTSLIASAAWDMNTLNETGRKKGRFLFTVFEQGFGGVQRHDLKTGETDTIWQSQTNHKSFDASFWTPWGTFITGEESWGVGSNNGRLFELKNPTTAPAITNPLSATSNDGAHFVHQNVIPRTSHEGIQFDKDGNMYFIDELNGGNVYKYTPAAKMSKVKNGKADYFAAGTTSVLRVGDGSAANATGTYSWVPFTDANGNGLPGAVTITDVDGVLSVDARLTANLDAFKGTDYQRPEDLQIQTVKGKEFLYMATTTTNEVYRLDLKTQTISVFANRSTIDLATGNAVDTGLTSPDNLAVDHDGNIYIVEDRNGGVDDDIWFAKDLNKDGDLTDLGEGIGRWATNGTLGSEFTGLYFDPFNKNRAWVNIQHPTSGNDRAIEIKIARSHDDDDAE